MDDKVKYWVKKLGGSIQAVQEARCYLTSEGMRKLRPCRWAQDWSDAATAELHLYVDGTSGDDANDGLTALTPKKTLQAVLAPRSPGFEVTLDVIKEWIDSGQNPWGWLACAQGTMYRGCNLGPACGWPWAWNPAHRLHDHGARSLDLDNPNLSQDSAEEMLLLLKAYIMQYGRAGSPEKRDY